MARFKSFCKDCGKLYQPYGKYQKYCFDCITKRKGTGFVKLLKMNYKNKKEKTFVNLKNLKPSDIKSSSSKKTKRK